MTTPDGASTGADDRVVTMLLASVGTLTGALALVGTATGQIARTYRNHPWLTLAAVVLVVVAFACGLVFLTSRASPDRRRAALKLGATFLVGGTAIGFVALLLTIWQSDRPAITLKVEPVADAEGLMRLDVEVQASGARTDGTLVVTLTGQQSGSAKNPVRLYYAKIGPNSDGLLIDRPSIVFDPTEFDQVRVYSAAYKSSEGGEVRDCDGRVLGWDNQLRPESEAGWSPASPDLVGCSSLEVPVVPAPTVSKAT